MIKGYARVSTDGQDLATQHELLEAAGATLVYAEKQSGVKTDRVALARCMRSLEAGDVILVTKLDRLARSTRDLLNTLATIGEAGGALDRLVPLGGHHGPARQVDADSPWRIGRVRTPSDPEPNGRRQAKGKARGVRFGRRPKLTKHQQSEALGRIAQGETLAAIARSYNVSHMTISRLADVTFMQ